MKIMHCPIRFIVGISLIVLSTLFFYYNKYNLVFGQYPLRLLSHGGTDQQHLFSMEINPSSKLGMNVTEVFKNSFPTNSPGKLDMNVKHESDIEYDPLDIKAVIASNFSNIKDGPLIDCIDHPTNITINITRRHFKYRYTGQTPSMEEINSIIKDTFYSLPLRKARQFCLNLSQMEKKNEITISELGQQDKWGMALAVFASLGYEQKLPNVLGIGVKKSGTTAFEHFLKQHPLVKVPYRGLERHFFDWHYDRGISYYKANLPISNETEICFEKSPRYFVTDTAPANIAKDISPGTKFILSVRDPVERARSDWRHQKRLQLRKKGADVCEGCTPVSEGAAFMREVFFKNGTVNAQSSVIKTSIYAHHFERWLHVFQRTQFLILKEEDITRTPFQVLQRAEDFLGIPHFFQEVMFVQVFQDNKRKSCYKPRDTNATYCMLIDVPLVPKPQITDEVIKSLRDFYRPYNKRFEEMTGIKFLWSNL